MLMICEIFHSLQGEGPFIGRPAVFVRLSGCVVPYCEFCDTPEALEPGTPIKPETIIRQVCSFNKSLVVITGGEPFVQWEQGLREMSQTLVKKEMTLQFETSGRAGIPKDVTGTVVLSPKPGKWPSAKTLSRAHWLKPLVGDDPEETLNAVKSSGFPRNRVWLMPLGKSREEQLRRMPVIWDLCVRHGYCLSPRLHILAHDRKKQI